MTSSSLPLVSIVAPNYNHAPYLGACLDSLMFQDYPNLELIIVDDASTDHSRGVIRDFLQDVGRETVSFVRYYNEQTDSLERTVHLRYPQEGRRIIYLENERNLGSTVTYNRGLRAAGGEFCTFVATDDMCHPQFVSVLVETLTRTGADFAYANMFIIDDSHRILREFKLPDYSFRACFEDWYLCGAATLYRRILHERLGWYDKQALADDHECYLRFALAGARFVHVDRTLYSVRSHATRQCGLHEPARYQALLKDSQHWVLEARKAQKRECRHG